MLSHSGLVETPKTHSAVLQLKFIVNLRFYDPYRILSHSTLLCHSVVENLMVQTSHPPQRWASFCPLGLLNRSAVMPLDPPSALTTSSFTQRVRSSRVTQGTCAAINSFVSLPQNTLTWERQLKVY